jgi:hypothetical protein
VKVASVTARMRKTGSGRANGVLGIFEGQPAGHRLVDDTGSDLGVERVQVDVEVDLLDPMRQLVEGGENVALRPSVDPWHDPDRRTLEALTLRLGLEVAHAEHDDRLFGNRRALADLRPAVRTTAASVVFTAADELAVSRNGPPRSTVSTVTATPWSARSLLAPASSSRLGPWLEA